MPVPRPEWSVTVLNDAQGSFVIWPCAWVRFSDKALKKKTQSAKKVKNLDADKESSQDNRSKENEVDSKANNNKADSQPKSVVVGKISSKGSSPDVNPKGTPLVCENVSSP
ncbi:uncharacterized protein LOC130591128 [Beta vulgaris subsp. vulgaris]|uniref:uncharacterized protein LOC130591128 n=1 Tax=Beta vulgaris subsp. vulgaris TaxID=3555 RepID=UPI0025498C3A|nr:uncharacterized protein LOC130591128 [Beta vulgaris subsp. vulgaris]